MVRTVPSPVVTIRRQPHPGTHRTAGSAGGAVDRRSVLRGGLGLGAVALGGSWLAACGGDSADGTRVADGQVPENALIAAFPQGVPHVPTGVPTRLPYLLADKEGVPLSRIDGPVTFTVEQDGRAVGQPVQVAPRSDGVPRAYLPLTFTFPQAGFYDVFAAYGGAKLDSTIQVYGADQIGPPVVGEQLPPAATATMAKPLVDPVCSRVPPCPFHEVDLVDAIGKGKPIVLMVATPAYCQTAVCGPILDTLVDQASGRTDITVIHSEVYRNPKDVRDIQDANLAPVPDTYDLRFEPAMFVTNAAGTIVARADITVDRTEMTELLALAK